MSEKISLIKPKPSDMRSAIDILTRDLPLLIEHSKLIAKIRKSSYDAYIDEGFAPNEALELCKTMTL